MVAELVQLFQDLDQEKLRIGRPSKAVFLCGGVIGLSTATSPRSLRDYLHRIRPFQGKLHGTVVLAEAATQLYRDTNLGYEDLISFEEDIARIAAIVLVIAESPGSLAELGAFASNETIRRALRIIAQTKHSNDESFIRFGPIERIKKDGEGFVGWFPWRVKADGSLILGSVKPHYAAIVDFINENLDKLPKSEKFPSESSLQNFYIIYWVVYLWMAVPISPLGRVIQSIIPSIELREIRTKLYCMKIAGWIGSYDYSGQTYYYARYDQDPFSYAFKEGVKGLDTSRRKAKVIKALRKVEKAPNHVLSRVTGWRVPP